MLRPLTLVICASLGLNTSEVAADFAIGGGDSDDSKSEACQEAKERAYDRIFCPAGQHTIRQLCNGCTCYSRGDPDKLHWDCDASYSYTCGY